MPVLNPFVRGDTDAPTDPEEVRILFDELRRIDGVEHAKDSITDWEKYTHDGDPYPIPGKVQSTDNPERSQVKGHHGFLVDTNEESWEDKFVEQVRARSAGPDQT